MATLVDDGPASNTAVLIFGTNAPGLEVHVGTPTTSSLNPLNPNFAPYSDPQIAATFTAVQNKVVAGSINFSNPS